MEPTVIPCPAEGEGVSLTEKRNLHLVARSIAHGWPIPSDLLSYALERVEYVLRHPEASKREILAAVRTLVGIQESNRRIARDERSAGLQERGQDLSALRAALSTPEGRAALAAVADAAINPCQNGSNSTERTLSDVGQGEGGGAACDTGSRGEGVGRPPNVVDQKPKSGLPSNPPHIADKNLKSGATGPSSPQVDQTGRRLSLPLVELPPEKLQEK